MSPASSARAADGLGKGDDAEIDNVGDDEGWAASVEWTFNFCVTLSVVSEVGLGGIVLFSAGVSSLCLVVI